MPSAAVLEYILSNYFWWATLDSQMGLWETRWNILTKRSRPKIVWKPTMPFFSFLSVVFSFHDLYVFGRCNVQSRDGDKTQLWLCLHSREGGKDCGRGCCAPICLFTKSSDKSLFGEVKRVS